MSRSPYASPYERLVANTTEPGCSIGCWEWTGKAQRGGYGRFNLYVPGLAAVVSLSAHVALYVAFHAAARTADDLYLAYLELRASGLQVDHLCVNPPCCNPDHLEAVTPSENNLRRARGGWRHGTLC